MNGDPAGNIHFTKHNYAEQFAIVGKSKELHCCVGPNYESLMWYKDDIEFPWDAALGKERNTVLYRLAKVHLTFNVIQTHLAKAITSP